MEMVKLEGNLDVPEMNVQQFRVLSISKKSSPGAIDIHKTKAQCQTSPTYQPRAGQMHRGGWQPVDLDHWTWLDHWMCLDHWRALGMSGPQHLAVAGISSALMLGFPLS